jgi:hypothetical protein
MPANMPISAPQGGAPRRRGERVNNDPSNFFGSAIQPLMRGTMNLWRTGQGFNPFTGPRVAPFNPFQRGAYRGLHAMASGRDPTMGSALRANQNLAQTGGAGPNSQIASRLMRQIGGGGLDIRNPFFAGMVRNPLSQQQRTAGGVFGRAAGGGMNVDGNALYGGLGSNPFVDRAAGGYGRIANQADRDSFAERNLRAMASGRYLSQGNPFANRALENAMGEAQAGIASDASLSGISGSSAHAGMLAGKLGGMATQFAADQYERDKNLMLGANQQLDASRAARMGIGLNAMGGQLQAGATQNQIGMGVANAIRAAQEGNYARQLTGAGQLAGIGQQGIENQFAGAREQSAMDALNLRNRMGAADFLSGMDMNRARTQLGAIGNAPGLSDSRYNPFRVMLGAGGQMQGQTQNEYDAARDLWNEQQRSPWDRLGAAGNIILGGGLPGATLGYQQFNDQQNASQPNPFLQGLGYAGMGANLLTNTGLMQPLSQAAGGALSGIGNWFGGLF